MPTNCCFVSVTRTAVQVARGLSLSTTHTLMRTAASSGRYEAIWRPVRGMRTSLGCLRGRLWADACHRHPWFTISVGGSAQRFDSLCFMAIPAGEAPLLNCSAPPRSRRCELCPRTPWKWICDECGRRVCKRCINSGWCWVCHGQGWQGAGRERRGRLARAYCLT